MAASKAAIRDFKGQAGLRPADRIACKRMGRALSYAPSLTGMFALAADYVDHIAKGDKPAGLPIQQPTKFELVINLNGGSCFVAAPPDHGLP